MDIMSNVGSLSFCDHQCPLAKMRGEILLESNLYIVCGANFAHSSVGLSRQGHYLCSAHFPMALFGIVGSSVEVPVKWVCVTWDTAGQKQAQSYLTCDANQAACSFSTGEVVPVAMLPKARAPQKVEAPGRL